MSNGIVVNHMHCYICGKAMPFEPDRKVCSPECGEVLQAQNKKRKQLMYFLYGAMALTLLLLFFGAR